MKSSLCGWIHVKLQVIELGFRTNLNKFLYLVCEWVITHIRMVFEVIHERNWKKDVTPQTIFFK